MYVKHTIPHTFQSDAQCNTDLDVGLVKLHERSKKSILMCRVYRPLSAEYKYFENLIDTCNTGRLYADDDVNLTMMGESLSSSPVCFIENLKSFCSY